MKINIGDLLITTQNNSVIVTEITSNGMLVGIYCDETIPRKIGWESNIRIAISSSHWKHYPVKE